MRDIKQLSGPLVLSLFLLAGCHGATPQQNLISGTVISGASTPQPALRTVRGQQGGGLAYTAVAGASNQAGGLTFILRTVHNDCGEQPKIGQPFQFSGTQMVGVFFTVVNHSQGNEPLAGLALATLSGPNQVQAGLVFDDASRIGSTVNPLLTQLLSMWRPTGPAVTSNSGRTTAAAQPSGQPTGPAAQLHTITTQDKTASVGIPDGWTMFPDCHQGLILLTGPKGEHIILNQFLNAWDPTAPRGIYQQIKQRPMMQLPKLTVFYPFNVDMAKSFSDLWQAMVKAEALPPQPMQIASAENLPASNGEKCAHATGQLNPGPQLNPGGGTQAFNLTICADPPDQQGGGIFAYHIFEGLLPNSIAAQENATELAIMNSFRVDGALLAQIVNAKMAPILKQEQQNYDRQEQALINRSEQIVNQIHGIGQQATERMNETEDNNARNDQGFDNYLLDQSVVQNNATGGHSTQWNSTANQMVRANPGKYQIVSTPNYIRGTDY
jgi:hypothetical protein